MKKSAYLAIALALLLGACNYQAGGDGGSSPPQAWIDQPLDGSQYLIGDRVPIQWHASGEDGLRWVEVRVNGELLDTADTLDGDFSPDLLLVQGEVDWAPAEAGDYLIQVQPTGPDDAVGEAAENLVHVYAEGGTISGMVAKDFNLDGDAQDEGEGPLEGATVILVECGDKLTAQTNERGQFEFTNVPLGNCVIDASKPGWFFAGTHPAGFERPLHVWSNPELPTSLTIYLSQEATPTPTVTPTATQIVLTAAPPLQPPATSVPTKPAPDTQPPPIPVILSPRGGEMLGCLDNIILRWNPVSDASGIDVYQVELHHSHDNGESWEGGGTWTLDQFTSLDVSPQTDCGLMYLWKVRARDNAGNTGGWGMTTFAIGIE